MKSTNIGIFFTILICLLVVIYIFPWSYHLTYSLADQAEIHITSEVGNFSIQTAEQRSSLFLNLRHTCLNKPVINFEHNIVQMKTGILNGEMLLPRIINLNDVVLTVKTGKILANMQYARASNIMIIGGSTDVVLTIPQDVTSTSNVVIGTGTLAVKIPTEGLLDAVKIRTANMEHITFGDEFEKTADGIQTKGFENAQVTSVINVSPSKLIKLSVEEI